MRLRALLLVAVACGVSLVGYGVWASRAPTATASRAPTVTASRAPAAKAEAPRVGGNGRMTDPDRLDAALDALPPIGSPATGPDVVVIVLDTLRADRLARYGGTGVMPRLDAWAERARVYTHMTADGAWTVPSHASLFTGRSPRTHGARGAAGPTTARGLPAGTPTLAGALSDAGWRTVGIAANRAYLAERYGLGQGFDVWLCEELAGGEKGQPPAERIAALGARVLARERTAPVFLFLNFMDVHPPWVVREELADGEIDRALLPHTDGWAAAQRAITVDGEERPDATLAWTRAYDASARYLDAQVGALLARLPELGVGEEDLVVVLSDHGELLGEHGAVGHGRDVWESLVHVPLFVRGKGFAPGEDATPVQHHDIARMVLAAAGLPPLPGSEEPDALQVVEATPPGGERTGSLRHAFREGDRKLVVDPKHGTSAFDLAADPDERAPVAGAPWAADLAEQGRAWLAARPVVEGLAPPVTDQREALRALGYTE
jgi:arylsulfatase A-like enzyme